MRTPIIDEPHPLWQILTSLTPMILIPETPIMSMIVSVPPYLGRAVLTPVRLDFPVTPLENLPPLEMAAWISFSFLTLGHCGPFITTMGTWTDGAQIDPH